MLNHQLIFINLLRTPKDTLNFEILRNNEISKIRLTQKDIVPKYIRINWSDLEDMQLQLIATIL